MIFLPPVHISPEKSIPIDHAKFVLGNQLYFMHWESHLPIKCKMKSVDLQTFKVSSVEVRFENESLNSYFDIGVEDKVPSVYEAVVVQRDKAFFWDYSDNFLLEGRVDAEGFHWRKINTTGPKPPIGESLAYDEGSGNVMCVLAEGLSDEPLSLYRLDLTTFVWTRQGMRISNQAIVDELRKFRLWLYLWASFGTGQYIHFVRTQGPIARSHLIFNQTTLEWSIDDAVKPNRLPYTDGRHLYVLCRDSEAGKNTSTVSRFDCISMAWTQVQQIANVLPIDHSSCDCFQVGTRIVIVVGYRYTVEWVETILVLELEPTLFDLASTALWRDQERARTARSVLPSKILDELICLRVITEKEDDSGDDDIPPNKRCRTDAIQKRRTPRNAR